MIKDIVLFVSENFSLMHMMVAFTAMLIIAGISYVIGNRSSKRSDKADKDVIARMNQQLWRIVVLSISMLSVYTFVIFYINYGKTIDTNGLGLAIGIFVVGVLIRWIGGAILNKVKNDYRNMDALILFYIL